MSLADLTDEQLQALINAAYRRGQEDMGLRAVRAMCEWCRSGVLHRCRGVHLNSQRCDAAAIHELPIRDMPKEATGGQDAEANHDH